MSSPESQRLLAWYRGVARDLPWRRTRDPYAIWVSEIMLQQTRVETVVGYYGAFLDRFSTLEELAAAPVEQVLAAWSGLGYYRRARQLHTASREVLAAGGKLPRTAAALLRLPGVGAYTAAAIASIAYGEVVAVLDGNVERVTARLTAESDLPKDAAARRRLLAVATSLIDPSAPGDSNQALMELGATVCLPRAPRCTACPLQSVCRASRRGETDIYPTIKPPTAARALRAAAVVLEEGGRVLLRRRPASSAFLPGTWEPPWIELGPQDDVRVALAAEFPSLRAAALLGRITHGITFRRFSVEVFEGRVGGDGGEVAETEAQRFVSLGELAELPTSALARKILRAAHFQ